MNPAPLFFTLLLSLSFFTAPAQRITGTWKRTGNLLVNADGSNTDLHSSMIKSMPCAAETIYTFEENGKHYTHSPKGCGMIDKISTATWSQTGNTLNIYSNTARDIGTVYTLSFSGNKVVFTHVYTDTEKAKLHIKTTKIIITYQRV